MATLDASVISQIGNNTAKPVDAIGRAYQLKDLIDQEQLGALKLGQEKQQAADVKTARKILSQSDISTPEGMMKASEKLARAGLTQPAMDLLKESQNTQQTQMGLDEEKIKLLQLSADVIGPTALQLKQVAQTQGIPMAQALYQQYIPQLIQQIPQQYRAQIPAQAPRDPQAFLRLLDGAINNSAHARQIITNQLAQRKEETAEKTETERERHDREMESLGRTKQTNSTYNDDERDLLAALAVRNVNLPAGMRSQGQIKATLDGLLTKEKGRSADQIADDIVSGKLKLTAETAGSRVAGTQIGKVAVSANELDTFGDQVITASDAVPRGSFVPWNKLRNYGRAQISSPQLLNFQAKMQALENAYDQLAARSGTDVEKRERIHRLFNEANSQEAVRTLVRAVKQEAEAARTAANRTIAETSGSSIPGTEGAPGQPQAQANDPLGIR